MLFFCSIFACYAGAREKSPADQNEQLQSRSKKKWKQFMKTLGGRQVWGDTHFFRGWKIQQNVLTKHYRLLDDEDVRHASGTFDECLVKLEEIKKKEKLKPMKGKAVILIHGIIRSSKSFIQLHQELKKEGYIVCGFEYPSTRVSIPESAEYLHQTILSLKGIEEIYFVAHSMGGLVVRSYLKKHEDKRIKRMVMMGVPNKGANMADRLADNVLYKMFYGPAGQQLVSENKTTENKTTENKTTENKTGEKEEGFVKSLPIPSFEFGIIAGGHGNMHGYNPLIPGDDDGTVSVSSTRLPGASDYILVHCLHSFLMFDDDICKHTRLFLQKGHFRKQGEPHPILKTIPKEKEE